MIMRWGANAADAAVAGVGWLLVLLRIAGDDSPPPKSGFAPVAGLLLLFFGLLLTARLGAGSLSALKALPFFLFAGLLLMARGAGGLCRQWRSLLILVLMIPLPSPDPLVNPHDFLTRVHAEAAAFLLHYLGYDITIHGLILTLPSGSVDVYPGCSGRGLMVLLLKISLIVSFGLRISWKHQLVMCAGAIAVGFLVGVSRIAVMALALPDPQRFEWLHRTTGSSFFATLGLLIFAPLLIPAEKPMADLLRAAWTYWKAAGPSRKPDLGSPFPPTNQNKRQ